MSKPPHWFIDKVGPMLAIALHQEQKRRWLKYKRFLHWLLISWFCPCCKAERGMKR